MSERIVDEAFAAELAESRGSSEDERFNRVLELNDKNSAEVIALLLGIIRDQHTRIARLEEQLYRVYVKSGESMAHLKDDLSTAESSTPPRQIVDELHSLRSDVFSRTDLQLQHIEERMAALEHDAKRAAEKTEKRLSDLDERLDEIQVNQRKGRDE